MNHVSVDAGAANLEEMPRSTYQWRLRALGAFLDAQPAADVSIVEVGTRFALRFYDARRTDSMPVFTFVDEQHVERITNTLLARRQVPIRDAPQVAPRYQDLLRALGWELDDLEASHIVIDERGEGLYVAYRYTSPEGVLYRKRVAHLGVPEWESILIDAKKRRRGST